MQFAFYLRKAGDDNLRHHAGARLYSEGQQTGPTPFSICVPAGTYVFTGFALVSKGTNFRPKRVGTAAFEVPAGSATYVGDFTALSFGETDACSTQSVATGAPVLLQVIARNRLERDSTLISALPGMTGRTIVPAKLDLAAYAPAIFACD